GWPVRVSYTYEANGRLHVSARLQGHEAGVTTEFHCENSLPDEDVQLWMHYVDEETKRLRWARGAGCGRRCRSSVRGSGGAACCRRARWRPCASTGPNTPPIRTTMPASPAGLWTTAT